MQSMPLGSSLEYTKQLNAALNSSPQGPCAIPPKHGQSQLISPVSGSNAPCWPASSLRASGDPGAAGAALAAEPSSPSLVGTDSAPSVAAACCVAACCAASFSASACLAAASRASRSLARASISLRLRSITLSTVTSSSSLRPWGAGLVWAVVVDVLVDCYILPRKPISFLPLIGGYGFVEGRNSRAGSSAKSGLVLYQYSAAAAAPHLAADPFHVAFLGEAFVETALRGNATVLLVAAFIVTGRNRRSGARNIVCRVFGSSGKGGANAPLGVRMSRCVRKWPCIE